LQGRPPIRSAEKRSQRPDDYRFVSGDAPNRSWTDSVWKAAAAFLCFSVALLIVGQPLQKATALSETAQRVGRQAPAQAARQAKHGNRLSDVSAASSASAFSLPEVRLAFLAA
jgi:heme exporter protein D